VVDNGTKLYRLTIRRFARMDVYLQITAIKTFIIQSFLWNETNRKKIVFFVNLGLALPKMGRDKPG
jgi:hypothetical protein